MGAAFSSCSSHSLTFPTGILYSLAITTSSKSYPRSNSNPFLFRTCNIFHTHLVKPIKIMAQTSLPSSGLAVKCGKVEGVEIQEEGSARKPMFDYHGIDQDLLQEMVYDALVWSSLHGLVIGDKSVQRSGKVPGVGLVHAPFALLPMPLPESQWRQACELAPIFSELVDRVSLDGKFLQESLSRTKKADAFTARLLDIHSKMLEINKKEEIRLGLHRSDYMLDEQTKLLFQIELNTISSSFPGLSCLVTELHRSLLNHYGDILGLDPKRIPGNTALSHFVEAFAKAWTEYNNPRAVVMFVVQAEERNMYDQHWLSAVLKERHSITTIRKTMAEIDTEGELLPDGTLLVDGKAIAVIYFRAGYSPNDYPSESEISGANGQIPSPQWHMNICLVNLESDNGCQEWKARLLMEQSSAIKCPSISYHLAGTKKIQQELAKPDVLERFLDDKEDIAKLRKCFAGLWSLDDLEIVKKAIEVPELFVMKPQREGGGNNIYGSDVRETLLRLQKEGTDGSAAYILMQRIFPNVFPTFLMRDGICHKDHAMSELGIYGAYLRNKNKVIMNDQCGYLLRTKTSSSDEGGVAAGFAVLDSIYLT